MSKKVIAFHYTLTDKTGATLDSSVGAEPLAFLEGVGQIIPGLEKELVTMQVGQKSKINVAAQDAYGVVDSRLVAVVGRQQFPPDMDVKVGDRFQVANENDDINVYRIVSIEGDKVTIDGNHELAGVDLVFDVEISTVREATQEELTHGHAHGAHGHHHH